MGTRRATVLAVLVAALAAPGGAAAAAPRPEEAIPRQPKRLAHTLLVTTREARAAVDRWLEDGDPAVGRPPRELVLVALRHQRIYRLLRHDPALASATIRLLPSGLAREARDVVVAGRKLGRITPPLAVRRIRTGPARPAGVLLRHYREAERRFGVAWELLAAVNFVESAFGKVRSASAAGAQGPMQFMPATWRAYGLGGDVHDPRDAIMGAANYLRASGAPRDEARALHRYNPSRAYVDAVLRYTRRMRRDPRAFYVYYAWQVIVRTPSGDVRLTGPGR